MGNCFSRQHPAPGPAMAAAAPTPAATTPATSPTKEDVINSLEAVSDPTDLKAFVGIIKQLLEEKRREKGSTSESAEEKGMWASFVKGGAIFLKFANDHTVSSEKSKTVGEISKAVGEILSKIGELHWVAGGLTIVAYLIEKCEKVSANKAEALKLLSNMVDLATTVFKLKDVIPEEKEKLEKAVMLLVEGSIMCVSQIYSENIFSFLKTLVHSENLTDMSKTLSQRYNDLNLTITTAIAKRQPILLPVLKPFYPKHAVGIENAQEEVIKLLKLTPKEETPLVVVIYGFGGIGKTTLATSVVAKLDLDGYNFAWINLDEDISKNDLKKEQEQILRDAFPTFCSGATIEFRDCQECRHRLQEAFPHENKPIFLLIDNALRPEDLKELLPEDLTDLPKGSRIFLTTRRLDAADAISGLKRHPFAMKTLQKDHAMEILCKDPDNREAIKDDMERILQICGGVPLALGIVRGHLIKTGYNASRCGQILAALEKGISVKEESLSRRLVDFVYNQLEEGTKDAFLDICCFFNGWIRRHVEYIVGAQEVRSLEEAAFVTSFVDDDEKLVNRFVTQFVRREDMRTIYTGEERLVVHDIVRAQGRIRSGVTRFMDAESFSQAPKEELPQTKGIWLSDNNVDYNSFEAKHVDLMNRCLRVLHLGKRLNGRCERAFEELRRLAISDEEMLPIDLSKSRQLAFFHGQFKEQYRSEAKFTINLSDSLRILYLRGPRNSSISLDINGHLTLLIELHLSNIAFENFETRIRLGSFPCLKILNMAACSMLERLPESFGNLSSLQRLRMDSCSKLERLPESFGKLSSLQILRMDSCSKLERLPESFRNLCSLQDLDIARCSMLEKLPESFGNLSSLQTLYMDSCSKLERLPESFGNLSSLQTLYMDSCSKLERLPENFGNLFSLQDLDMAGCSVLERLPESFGNLSSLQALRMDSCSMLESLPQSFENLSSLLDLDMAGCSMMERLPQSFENLSSVQTLRMNSCSKLERLPQTFGNLSSLRDLDMAGCSMLERLPESFGNLSSLKTLHMDSCSKLERLPESFGNLYSLQELDMAGRSMMERLPESFGNLSSLETLRMDRCSKLKRLTESFGNLSSLRDLDMAGCSMLERLPESFGNLSSLRTVTMDRCSKLERLPESFGNLSSLQTLRLGRCSKLERLPESFENLSSLRDLDIGRCSVLERLPESFGNLSPMQDLDMGGCSMLERLPESFGNLSSMQTLRMDSCSKLERLSESFGNLSSLQELDMAECSMLERLPESFGNLSSLQTLHMDSCSKLERLPESFGNLSSLQTLHMDNCSKLERLPESFGNLSSLRDLAMVGCSLLERLHESF